MGSPYLQAYAEAGLYTMQGRLSPPADGRFQSFPRVHWEREITLASQVPVRGIEWIYDQYGEGANPLETTKDRARMRFLLAQQGIRVVSICADYFMESPLAQGDAAQRAQRQERLNWLISVCPEMAIGRIVLPFVDESRMGDAASRDTVLRVLHEVLPQAQAVGVELHLEADFSPSDFRAFLSEIDHPLVRVNYDAGNSSALGYRPAEEFAAYGERIGSFHIKDRVRGGKTVPLGEGDADFASLRAALIDIDYGGDFVLQVARGEPGAEVPWLGAMQARACRWLRGEPLSLQDN